MSYVPKSTIFKIHIKQANKQKRKNNIKDFFKKLVALGFLVGAFLIILPQDINQEVSKLFNLPVQRLDINLKEIVIEGNSKVTNEQVLKAANLKIGENILTINLQLVKEWVEQDPWVEYAIIERVLPHTIKITVEEEKASAVFIQNSNTYLINDTGDIIEKIDDANIVKNYTYLIGQGANLDYAEILSDLYSNEEIHSNIEGLIKVNKRRWDVKLKNSITLKLPEVNVREALNILDKISKKNNILTKASIIDLRLLPDKIYIKYNH